MVINEQSLCPWSLIVCSELILEMFILSHYQQIYLRCVCVYVLCVHVYIKKDWF